MKEVTEATIRDWLMRKAATLTGASPSELDPNTPLEDYGIDSIQVASLAGELEHWLATSVHPSLMWEYPTINDLAKKLLELQAEGIRPANSE